VNIPGGQPQLSARGMDRPHLDAEEVLDPVVSHNHLQGKMRITLNETLLFSAMGEEGKSGQDPPRGG